MNQRTTQHEEESMIWRERVWWSWLAQSHLLTHTTNQTDVCCPNAPLPPVTECLTMPTLNQRRTFDWVTNHQTTVMVLNYWKFHTSASQKATLPTTDFRLISWKCTLKYSLDTWKFTLIFSFATYKNVLLHFPLCSTYGLINTVPSSCYRILGKSLHYQTCIDYKLPRLTHRWINSVP